MALTYAQKLSFAETVAELLAVHKVQFNENGLETDKRIKTMKDKTQTALQADAVQETLKANLVQATRQAVAAVQDAYSFASGALDAMAGVLGKNHPLSLRLHQLRDQMSREDLRGPKADKKQGDESD